MSDTTSSHFVRQDLVPERPAPVKTTGFIGFLRTRLFNSPTNILITIVSALLLWFILVPALKFVLVDAVWTGTDRTACLPKSPGGRGRRLLAFHSGQVPQFIYGFYPEPERWRVNLTFVLAAILLMPLLIPRLPGKGPNAILFFLAFPVIAFFLLRGGGLGGLRRELDGRASCRASTTASATAAGSWWPRARRRPSSDRCCGCSAS